MQSWLNYGLCCNVIVTLPVCNLSNKHMRNLLVQFQEKDSTKSQQIISMKFTNISSLLHKYIHYNIYSLFLNHSYKA